MMDAETTETLEALRRKWDEIAALDPMWAVWTDPKHKGRRWDPAAFYALGEGEVARLIGLLEQGGQEFPRLTALDFGCGVGRLTRPLARRFGRAVGFDISPTMIAFARSYTMEETAEYMVSDGVPLPCRSEEFDFVLSRNVLQHMPPPLIESYLGELVRVLSAKGLLVVQLPARRKSTGKDSEEWAPLGSAVDSDGYPLMDMYGVRRERVAQIVAAAGGRVVEVLPDATAVGWTGYTYLVRRA